MIDPTKFHAPCPRCARRIVGGASDIGTASRAPHEGTWSACDTCGAADPRPWTAAELQWLDRNADEPASRRPDVPNWTNFDGFPH